MKIEKIINALRAHKTFLISTHVNPDPDALSSEVALASFLRSEGKKVYIVNEGAVPSRYSFMPGVKSIRAYDKRKKIRYDAAIIIDCGDLGRIGKVQKLIDRDSFLINIDHHVTSEHFGDLNLVRPKASSTAEILFDLLSRAGFQFTRNVAVNLYIGIMTDTGSFRYENTTSRTHEIISQLMKFNFSIPKLYQKLYETISLNSLKTFSEVVKSFDSLDQGRTIVVELPKSVLSRFGDDIDLRDEIFRFFRKIKEVEVIAIFTEMGWRMTRVNFRSQRHVDVAKLANHFGGGGHRRASGCMIRDDIEGAKRKVLAKIRKMLR
ncbi:MAG: bifunctional oligoribonuclease/PAP phosphatase NrnA [Candidatus Omnitrophota bacterium]